MKSSRISISFVVSALAAVAVLAFAAPRVANASATGAGASLFNKVTVTYASGTKTDLVKTAEVTVTVTTLAAQPTITVDSQTASIYSGLTHLYTYTLKSNSNGLDTYAVTIDATTANTGMTANSSDALNAGAAAVTLWGSMTSGPSGVDGTGVAYITIPAGSAGAKNLLVDGALIKIGSATYKVKSSTPGQVQDTTHPVETGAKVYLQTTGGADITTDPSIVAGLQVGEYKTFTNTVTAGTPSFADGVVTDGTHVTQLHVVTSALGATQAVVTYTTAAGVDVVTTTILNPKLDITKLARNSTVSPAGSFVADASGRPGEDIEYELTITNSHLTATIATWKITESVPTYTTYKLNSSQISNDGGATFSAITDGGVSPFAGSGYTGGAALAGGKVAKIRYIMTIN